MSDLRDRVARRIAEVRHEVTLPEQRRRGISMPIKTLRCDRQMADAALAVFAEREREVRARIEALGKWPGNAGKVLLDRADVLAVFDEAVSEVVDKPVCSCGDLSWTVRYYGRVTHKEACRFRTDPWSQSYPRRGDDDEAVPDGEEAR